MSERVAYVGTPPTVGRCGLIWYTVPANPTLCRLSRSSAPRLPIRSEAPTTAMDEGWNTADIPATGHPRCADVQDATLSCVETYKQGGPLMNLDPAESR